MASEKKKKPGRAKQHNSEPFPWRVKDKIADFMDGTESISSKVGAFLHKVFRPVRHLFYRLFDRLDDASDRVNDGIADAVGHMAFRAKMRKEEQSTQLLASCLLGYHPSLDRLRLILMLFMCINLFGFPTVFGGLIQQFCGFVPIAFFILSGYLVLRESEHRPERIVRAIERTAIVFGALVIVYFILNLIYYQTLGVNIFAAFASKRLWFNFIVLNIWPFDIGTAIWYVQSLLYAYIIIYFLDRWKLLRFDWLIAGILIVFTIITGELAGVIRWSFLGYNYIPGNFLTRALPYTLLGCFLHRKSEAFDKIRRRYYIYAIPVGAMLMAIEVLGLGVLGMPGYYGHLIGMPVIALSVCMLAIKKSGQSGFEKKLGMSRWHINSIYYLCQPVSIGVAVLLSATGSDSFAQMAGWIGIITFMVCFGIARLIAFIGRKSGRKKVNG